MSDDPFAAPKLKERPAQRPVEHRNPRCAIAISGHDRALRREIEGVLGENFVAEFLRTDVNNKNYWQIRRRKE